MRIAICTDQYLPMLSGLVDSVATLTMQLQKDGHEVRLYTPNLPRAKPEPHIFHFLAFAVPGSGGSMTISFPFGAMKDMRRFNPDVVHTHLFGSAGFLAWYAARRLNVPLIGTDHTFPADYLHYLLLDFPPFPYIVRKFAAWFYGKCDFVTTPGKSILDELHAYGMQKPSRVISNHIPLDLFRPLPDRSLLKKKWGIETEAVLIFGRIAAEKNLDAAIDVFAHIATRTDAHLVFLGDGPYRSVLEKKLQKLGLEKRTHFLGQHRGETLVEAVNACDVCLITSTSETQSMTTIQSLACGVPVVAARAGGLPEYVRDGDTGYLVSPDDREGFAERIASILNDAALRERLGRAGRESVLRFSPEHITAQFEEVYAKAIHI